MDPATGVGPGRHPHTSGHSFLHGLHVVVYKVMRLNLDLGRIHFSVENEDG